ncbi:anion transporter [Candidatus Oscillochloris fontis]|uniref:anion transporter n=1 Tax=Candidatus Oscillochloris fontis TaxID=2496868 RepID=UPI00101C1916|nr:anion transporter [Candidatus Oscillochloris fontis]
MEWREWATLLIVAVTIGGIAVGRWPWLRADRTGITLIGATLLLGIGALSLEEAYAGVDIGTIILLFSMMVINSNLYLAGFFGVVTRHVVRTARGPRTLLALIILASGVLSALFLNDTIVLMLTPIILDTTRALKRSPLPYLLGLATAANVGSMATITGNPQNIIIGGLSHIRYVEFVQHLGLPALLSLGICWLVIVLVYREEMRGPAFRVPDMVRTATLRPLLRKSMLVISAMLLLFLLGVPIPLAALLAAATLMTTRRLRPDRVWKSIDWTLLLFFAALFVVTHALETQQLSERLFEILAPLAQAGLIPFGLVTVVLSNLISNVPAVLLLQGLVPAFAETQRAWFMLAATATLAGNLTLLGSVANLIMAELAGRWGVRITFFDYVRVGMPVTILSLMVTMLLI